MNWISGEALPVRKCEWETPCGVFSAGLIDGNPSTKSGGCRGSPRSGEPLEERSRAATGTSRSGVCSRTRSKKWLRRHHSEIDHKNRKVLAPQGSDVMGRKKNGSPNNSNQQPKLIWESGVPDPLTTSGVWANYQYQPSAGGSVAC